MLNVTEKAAQTLRSSLEANQEDEAQVLRLVRRGEGLGLGLDHEREGDQVVEHEDRKVLVIEESVSQALDGATLDAEETPEGTRLVFQPP